MSKKMSAEMAASRRKFYADPNNAPSEGHAISGEFDAELAAELRGGQMRSHKDEEYELYAAGLSITPASQLESCALHETEDWCFSEGRPHANIATQSHKRHVEDVALNTTQLNLGRETAWDPATAWLRKMGYGPDGEAL